MTIAQPIRTLIADDEPLARKRVRQLLEGDRRYAVTGEADSGRAAIAAIEVGDVDVVFLDIRMPGLDGFGVLRAIHPDRLPLIVFVTAHDEHAVRAFEVDALDYLLKPVAESRFRATLDRIALRMREPGGGVRDAALAALERLAAGQQPQRIAVRSTEGSTFVDVADIDWAEVVDDYVRLHVGSRTHLLREPMHALEARLAPPTFMRIHRSTLVNVKRVREVRPWMKGDYVLILEDGTRLVSGRTFRERVQKLLR